MPNNNYGTHLLLYTHFNTKATLTYVFSRQYLFKVNIEDMIWKIKITIMVNTDIIV